MAVSSPGEAMRRLRLEKGMDVAGAAAVTGLEAARIEDLEEDVASAWFQEALLLAAAYGITIEDFAREVSGSPSSGGSPNLAVRTSDVEDLP